MTHFHFSWRKTIITALVVATLLGLGMWQLQRLQWKTDLLAAITDRQIAPPITTLPKEGTDLNFRRVTLTGFIDRSAGFRLQSRVYDGKAGQEYIVPMVIPTGSKTGTVVLLNLGWVPSEWKPMARAAGGIETVSGTLYAPARPSRFTPDNPPTGDTLYWIDTAGSSIRLQAPVSPHVLYLDRLGDAPPIGGQLHIDLPNNHLQYAITWFLLAGIVMVMYVMASRTKE